MRPIYSSSRRLISTLILASAVTAPTIGSVGTGSQTLNATINAVGSITAPATAALSTGTTGFQPFTGALAIGYRARTTPAGGGSITVNVTADFTPTGGPSVANGVLQYTCSGATLGVGCSGTQTATTSSQTPVATLPSSACTGGGAPCSSADPNTVNVFFTLADQPTYSTGTYSARVTFTISAI